MKDRERVGEGGVKGCKRKRGRKQRENKLIKRGFKRTSSGDELKGRLHLSYFYHNVLLKEKLSVAFVVVFVVCCFLHVLLSTSSGMAEIWWRNKKGKKKDAHDKLRKHINTQQVGFSNLNANVA